MSADWTPPAEAVEAAARALHEETSHPTPWESLPAWMVETKRYDAHAALAAARPVLVAEALAEVERLQREVSELGQASEDYDEEIVEAALEAAGQLADGDIEAETSMAYVIRIVDDVAAQRDKAREALAAVAALLEPDDKARCYGQRAQIDPDALRAVLADHADTWDGVVEDVIARRDELLARLDDEGSKP